MRHASLRLRSSRVGPAAVLLGVAAACGWPGLILAQEPAHDRPESRWYEKDAWRQPQGLPQDSVLAILQSRDGYMWFGTRAGLARFDGVRFTVFDDRARDQLRDNEVWALLEADDSLWLGTYGGGLTRLRQGRFSFLTTTDGLVNDFVRALARDAAGALWIGTDSGLSRFENERFTSFKAKDGLSHDGVRALHAGSDGRVWVATKGGLHTVTDGRIEVLTPPEPRPRALIDAVLCDSRGAVWIGTQDGLFRWAEGRTTAYTTADGLSSNSVRILFEDHQGHVWIATDVGLDRYTKEPSRRQPIVNEATLSDIRSLGADREGSLWVGSVGGGLVRLQQGPFAGYTAANGLPHSDVRTVLVARSGTRWIGTAKGLSALRAGTFSSFGPASGLPNAAVDALLEDRDGRLWVGTEIGLYRSQQADACSERSCAPRFVPVPSEQIPAMHARVLYQDRQGALWVGTNLEGLARYQDGRFTTYTSRDGLASDAVRDILEDRDGSLLVGTKGGVNRLRDGTFTVYTQKDGLPNDGVSALYLDGQGTLWIATRYGVGRLREGRITGYSTKDGLYASHVYGFIEDQAGRLWMGCAKGIFYVRKQELDDVAEGRARSVVSVAYGREHGLPSDMAAVATHPVSARSEDGRLWFATRGGLTVVDPQSLATNTVVPPVEIEELRIDGRAFDPDRPADVRPGRGDLAVRYTALSFRAPEKVRFKYRLEGFDADWIDADTRRVAHYTNVPPGRYRFRVRASNNDGLWNDAGAAIELRLAPHFYQTSWFYGLCALTLASAGAAAHRLRTRRLRQHARELSARVKTALAEVRVLQGLLPVCATCKKIRDEQGSWNEMETYIHAHSEADFTHGICPECAEKLYPGYAKKRQALASGKLD
jgi:ligand-binding sensor domain-containing protein